MQPKNPGGTDFEKYKAHPRGKKKICLTHAVRQQ
jgi:hypothetical protein